MSKEITKEEARKNFLRHISGIVDHWAGQSDQTDKEKCDGVAFSILVMLDGESMLPSYTVIPNGNPTDTEYYRGQEENYYKEISDKIFELGIGSDTAMHHEYLDMRKNK